MKLLCIIESLNSGGAERQLCLLAASLQRQGVHVTVATYTPGDFYRPMLTEVGIPHRELPGDSKWERLYQIRRLLRAGTHDVVLAFLQSTAMYALLAGLPRRRWGLVVSDRLALPVSERSYWRPQLYRWADYVTTNSHANRLYLEESIPTLRGRIVTVYNAVDLQAFRPTAPVHRSQSAIRFAVAASYVVKKNMNGLIEAVRLLAERHPDLAVEVDWYGATPPANPSALDDAKRLVASKGLAARFRLNTVTSDIMRAYQSADGVILPSFYEGVPNSICEAMACGRPVLMSSVCDAGNLVRPGENGFLFDPARPETIMRAIAKFCGMSAAGRLQLGENSRNLAERLFDPAPFTEKYLEILEAAARREKRVIKHLPCDIPETAIQFANNRSRENAKTAA